MDYEKALEKARSAYGTGAYDDATLEFLFPQLKESEGERIRKGIIEIIKAVSGPDCDVYLDEKKQEKYIAWLEKQKENIEKEYVFRPSAGTDINSAALQAIRRANEGDRLVLAFNGAYIPVREGCNANKIVDIYDAFIEKQQEQKPISSCDIVPYIDDKIAALQDMWREEKVAFDWDDMHEMIEDVARHFYQKEQKPAEWSEEDEEMLEEIINHIDTTSVQRIPARPGSAIGKSWIKFLKSLRPQPKQEWSEEEQK